MWRTIAMILVIFSTSLIGCTKKSSEGEMQTKNEPTVSDVSAEGGVLSGDYIVLPSPTFQGEMSLERCRLAVRCAASPTRA